MALRLPDSLLALADAVAEDGGRAVCQALVALLREAAPFDLGEVVLRREDGLLRIALGDEAQVVAGDDLIERVIALGEPVRIDDTPELDPYPQARAAARASGVRSLLAIPSGRNVAGVVVVGRRHGWSFVGASLHFLEPVAAMAGIALDRSLALSARTVDAAASPPLGRDQRAVALMAEVDALRAQARAGAAEAEGSRRARDASRDALARARGATMAAQSALDQAVRRCHELEARIADLRPAPTAAPAPPPAADLAAPPPVVSELAPDSEATPADVAPEAPASATPTAAAAAFDAGPSPSVHTPPRRRRRRKGGFEPPAEPSRS